MIFNSSIKGIAIFCDLNRLRGKISRINKILFLYKLKRRRIKIATIGCNLGPYNDNIGVMLTKLELKMNDLVTVRDSSSYNLIKKFKCIKNYHLADDIVYLLPSQTGVSQKDTCIGITAYRSLKPDECNFDNYLALSKIIDCYVSKTNNVVKLFAFDSENENDISAAYHIYELSNSKSHIQIVPYLGNTKKFLEVFFSCSRHISIRFHSAILSDLKRIPFLPIVYSNKMLNFLTDNNYEGDIFMLDKFKIENLDVEMLVQKLISGEGLFLNTDKKKEARKHFLELEKLINHYYA